MEKRDIIVIVVAVIIVLIMAMYIKPLVTGKPVQLIPSELAGLFGGKNQTSALNNTSNGNQTFNTSIIAPNISSIEPNSLDTNKSGTVLLVGDNFTDPSNVSFTQNGTTKEYQATLVNGSLQVSDVSLSEGNWSVSIHDTNSSVPIKTSKIIQVKTVITPVPTWDGKPVKVGYAETGTGAYISPNTGPESQYQPYSFKEKKNLTTYTEFIGQYPSTTNPFTIPQGIGYWELQYTVDYTQNYNNPKGSITSGDYSAFKFNQQRKWIVEDGIQKEVLITKGDTREEEDTTSIEPLVESYSVIIPTFSISVMDATTNQSIREITPDGGLDPLLWDKAAHKEQQKLTSQQNGKEIDDDVLDAFVKDIKDPRPWTEKFYSPGSFYLIVNPRNIKSYDIQIKVGSLTVKVTPSPTQVVINPLNQTLSNYIAAYNSDYLTNTYSSNVFQFYSSRIKQDSSSDLAQSISQSRAAGVTITSYKIFGTDIKGTGNLKGEITYQYKGTEKILPIDLNFVNDGGYWKIDTPILFRY